MKNRLPFIFTIILLCLALFAGEWLESRQKSAPKMELIPFEQNLGDWKGTDLKMDAEVVEMLNPDQIVFKRYRNTSGNSIDLYGVFYGSQGADRTMHSPLNCYPGTGWEIVGKSKVRLHGPDGDDDKGFEVRKLNLRKGLAKRVLYYWYYAGGKIASNQYMNKLLTLYGALFNNRTDGGLVTVATIQDDAGLNQEYLENDFIPRLLAYLAKQPISR
jgi:EpsI family protein